ncbi:MAG: AFG1-like ATPase-domain-containing protein [Monoraphidium minutum]|nr:MAG: AFG1-like ATPase-domain-containing protein [Monoraphidium minutum]
MLPSPFRLYPLGSRAIACLNNVRTFSSSSTGLPPASRDAAGVAAARVTAPRGAAPNALLRRYGALLSRGALRPDDRQAAVVGRLAGLLDELHAYGDAMRGYKAELEEYKQRAHLAAQCRRARVAAEFGPGPRPPAAPRGVYIHGTVGSGKSILMDMFFDAAAPPTGGGGGGGGSSGGAEERPALEFARRWGAARQECTPYVRTTPRMRASACTQPSPRAHTHKRTPAHTRNRMHFNAAMLDLHSRLHLLDLRREARSRDAHSAGGAHSTQSTHSGEAAPPSVLSMYSHEVPSAAQRAGGGGGGGGGGAVPAALLDRALELGEELEGGGGGGRGGGPRAAGGPAAPAAAGAGQGGGDDDGGDGAGDRQVARWFDEGSRQQKAARAAVLAVRRHIREARAGRATRARLAAANAAVMRAAARSFIRAAGADPRSGWEHGRGHAAALLCFDELQARGRWGAGAPHELPRHGLHEAMWEHFIDTVLDSCDIVELSAADDYRRLAVEGAAARQLQLPLGGAEQPLPAAAAGGLGAGGTAATAEPAAAAAAGLGAGGAAAVAAAPAAARAAGGSASGGSGACLEGERLYLWPLGPASDSELERLWRHLAAEGAAAAGAAVPVLFGRQLPVPRAAGGAAWFEFSELCARPLGSADYMALSHSFHTVFISGVPAMSMQVRDQARRFITLVDELYNARTLLVLSAAAPPDALFGAAASGEEPILDFEGLQFETAAEGARLRRDVMQGGGVAPVASSAADARAAADALGGAEERFAFARAVSRLYEMQSALYLRARPRA